MLNKYLAHVNAHDEDYRKYHSRYEKTNKDNLSEYIGIL